MLRKKNTTVFNLIIVLPARMKINAGSSAMLVNRDKLLKVSFSVQAQTPMANMLRPKSCQKNRHSKLNLDEIKVLNLKE